MNNALILILLVTAIIIICTISQSHYDYFEPVGDNDTLIKQLPIYVINLKHRQDRKERTINTLKQHDLTANYVEAVNGKELDLDDLIKRNIVAYDSKRKRYLRRGEIGCTMSHIKTWEMIKKSGAPYGLIFEDDVKFAPNFRHKLNAILHATHNLDWDVIYLGRTCYYNRVYWQNVKCVSGKPIIGDLVYPGVVGYGNFAYIIKASAIDKIMPYMYPIKEPIDVVIPDLYDKGEVKAVGLKNDIVAVVGNTDSDTTKIK